VQQACTRKKHAWIAERAEIPVEKRLQPEGDLRKRSNQRRGENQQKTPCGQPFSSIRFLENPVRVAHGWDSGNSA
jgi:hypothetical protein